MKLLKFSLWHSGNKSNYYPWGCGFYPWPRSVGQGSGVAVSCGVGCRHGSDPALLWLWHRPTAIALIRPLAWELPYVVDAALKSKKIKNKLSFGFRQFPLPTFFSFSSKLAKGNQGLVSGLIWGELIDS